jgi:hypothetical protein
VAIGGSDQPEDDLTLEGELVLLRFVASAQQIDDRGHARPALALVLLRRRH